MSGFRKTTLAFVIAGSMTQAYAGAMGPVCAPGQVTVPCENQAWDFGVTALLLKPIYDASMGYWGSTPAASGVTNYDNSNLDFNWGFKLEGSYHFNTGNDLNINWYHLDTDNQNFLAQAADVRPNGQTFAVNQTLTENSKWDAVNAELAQHADFSASKNMRFHGGVQYARIQTNASALATSGVAQLPAGSVPYSSRLDFSGFGPRTGLDMNYSFGNGFGMYAKTAAAVLVGTSKFNTSLTNTQTFATTVSSGTKNAMVPELEARLGADYSYMMSQGRLIIDAGWMWFNYFNAQHDVSGAQYGSESDFAATGPYVGLKYVGSV